MVAGGFGEAYVPSAIMVPGDPAATARNVVESESLFRWGFGYLPRVFAVGFVIMEIAFTLRTFLLVLAPAYASPLLLVTAGIVSRPSSCGCS